MGKRYVTNDTPDVRYVGGRMIAPGEGREVDEPDEAPPVFEEPVLDPDAPLRELLGGTVDAVKATLAEFGDDSLARLVVLEGEAEKPRKGVLEALANEQIRRADQKLQGENLGGDQGLDKDPSKDSA
jgi:hypothetical protein